MRQAVISRAESDNARRESANTAEMAGFLQGLFGAGEQTWASPTRIASPNPTLAEALDSAAARLSRDPDIDPLIRGELHRTIGRAFGSVGRMANARLQFEAARVIHVAELGAQHPAVAIDDYLFGSTFTLASPDSAEAIIRRALANLEQHRPDTIWMYLPALHNLALTVSAQGRLAEAEAIYARVIAGEQSRPAPRKALLAIATSALGFTLWNQGKSAPAIEQMQRGVAEFDSLPTADLGEHAAAMFTLATALVSRGRGAEAVPYLERVLPMTERVYGREAPVLMQVRMSFADALAAAGDTARADREAAAAIALGARLPPGNEGTRFQAEWTWTRQLRRQRRFVEAEQIARSQYRHAQKSVTGVPYFWADATFILGAVLVDLGRWAEAEPYLLDSYQTARDKLGVAHVRSVRVLPALVAVYDGLRRTAAAARYRALMPDSMRARVDSLTR
jgi:tetratricopeptide (TPR) repeat protein